MKIGFLSIFLLCSLGIIIASDNESLSVYGDSSDDSTDSSGAGGYSSVGSRGGPERPLSMAAPRARGRYAARGVVAPDSAVLPGRDGFNPLPRAGAVRPREEGSRTPSPRRGLREEVPRTPSPRRERRIVRRRLAGDGEEVAGVPAAHDMSPLGVIDYAERAMQALATQQESSWVRLDANSGRETPDYLEEGARAIRLAHSRRRRLAPEDSREDSESEASWFSEDN